MTNFADDFAALTTRVLRERAEWIEDTIMAAMSSQVLLQAAPLVELAQGIPASAKLDEQLDREFAAIMGHQPRVRVRKFRP